MLRFFDYDLAGGSGMRLPVLDRRMALLAEASG